MNKRVVMSAAGDPPAPSSSSAPPPPPPPSLHTCLCGREAQGPPEVRIESTETRGDAAQAHGDGRQAGSQAAGAPKPYTVFQVSVKVCCTSW